MLGKVTTKDYADNNNKEKMTYILRILISL